MSVTIQLRGMKEAVAALNQLEGRLKFKQLRIALNAAMGPVKRQAIANVSESSDTGLYAKSLRVKVKIPAASYNPAHHGKPAYGLVGAGRGIIGFRSLTKSGRQGAVSARTLAAATKTTIAGKGLIQTVRERDRFNPLRPLKIYRRRASRYAHVVEKGRKGKGAKHPLARAATQAAPAAFAAFQAKISDGILKVAAELHAKQRASFGLGISP